jgi:EmrB/QacA subfamily drug resistance transporter
MTEDSSKRVWCALGFLTLAVLTSIVDTSVMTVSTPSIAKAFGAHVSLVEWNTTIYSLLFGSTMLLWGKLGEMYGHKYMFVIGNAIFALGSALVGMSPTVGTMIASRALQGVGAAMLNPSAIALIALSFPPKQRSIAFGINGMAASIGVALGYVVGGACAEYWGWRWAFLVNLPLCLISAVGVWHFLPFASDQKEQRPRLDVIGAVQSLLGIGLVIFGLSEGFKFGWWQPSPFLASLAPSLPVSPIPFVFVVAITLIVLFWRRELKLQRSGGEPVFDVTLFNLASFRWGGVVSFLRTLSMFVVNYGIVLYLQIYEGVPALQAAIISFPNAAAGFFGAPIGGWLSNKIGAARSVQLGLVAQTIGTIWVWQIIAPTLSVWELIGPFAIFGFGSGLAGAQLTTASLQDVPRERTGDASGALITVRQLGASFAVATYAVVTKFTFVTLAMEGFHKKRIATISERDVVLIMFFISLACIFITSLIPNRKGSDAKAEGAAHEASSAE